MATGIIPTIGNNVTLNLATALWTNVSAYSFTIGRYAFVQFYAQGTPVNNKTIALDCPAPKNAPQYLAAGSPPSVVAIDSNGKLFVSSAGTGAYIGGTFVYEIA